MLSITTSLRTFGCCIAAVLILPGLGTPRSAGAQSTPARPPLRSAVFPADTGRVRVTHAAVFRALVDTVTSNLSRLEIHVTTLGPGESPHPPHRHAHEELIDRPHRYARGPSERGDPTCRSRCGDLRGVE